MRRTLAVVLSVGVWLGFQGWRESSGGREEGNVAVAAGLMLTNDEITKLQDILPFLSLGGYPIDDAGTLTSTIVFTGCNVQIVNGLGATNGDTGDPEVLQVQHHPQSVVDRPHQGPGQRADPPTEKAPVQRQ